MHSFRFSSFLSILLVTRTRPRVTRMAVESIAKSSEEDSPAIYLNFCLLQALQDALCGRYHINPNEFYLGMQPINHPLSNQRLTIIFLDVTTPISTPFLCLVAVAYQ